MMVVGTPVLRRPYKPYGHLQLLCCGPSGYAGAVVLAPLLFGCATRRNFDLTGVRRSYIHTGRPSASNASSSAVEGDSFMTEGSRLSHVSCFFA